MNEYNIERNYNEAVVDAMSCPSYKSGDIVLVDLSAIKDDCRVSKVRVAIVKSRSEYNSAAPVMQIIPMSKKLKKMDASYHVYIDKEDCEHLKSSGVALIEQMTTIDRTKVVHYIGRIKEPSLIKKLNNAIINQLDLEG